MKRTVITFGTFDLFHVGHVRILKRAAELGHRLFVGVSTDELTREKKGYAPVFSYRERAEIVGAMRTVDDVFAEESLELKRRYVVERRADVLVMGADWKGRFDDLADVCRIAYLPRTAGISTSRLRRITEADAQEF